MHLPDRTSPAGTGTPLLIGVSACILHADPQRTLYSGKALQYAEPTVFHWLMGAGAMPLLIPVPDETLHPSLTPLHAFAERLDGLLLEGGADMWPGHYGETPIDPRWHGDRARDEYELALLEAFRRAGKPVLGICRGLQVINVAFGGSLYQDLPTQAGTGGRHRDRERFELNRHRVELVAGCRLATLTDRGGGPGGGLVSSIHHQAIRRLGDGLAVEAHSAEDGIIEAVRWQGPSWIAAVQWHPEFHAPGDARMLPSGPLLEDFLAACRTR